MDKKFNVLRTSIELGHNETVYVPTKQAITIQPVMTSTGKGKLDELSNRCLQLTRDAFLPCR